MALKLKTAPALTPVSLAEAKAHCRVDHADDDAQITALITAATGYLDGYHGILGRALIEQEWELYYDAFPTEDDLLIPLGNLISITGVEYVDPTTLLYTTWAAANYEVDTYNPDGWVLNVETWPTIAETSNAVRITFKAGYGAAASAVPPAIRHAILMMVGHWYNSRETVGEAAVSLPWAADALIAPYRRISV